MAIWLSVILLVVVVSLFIQFIGGGDPTNYPPGPFAWPLVGNLFSIVGGNGFYSKILGLRSGHGDIFRLRLGEMSMIVVFGLQNVRQVLVEKGEIFKNRPNWLYIPANVIKNRGLFWTNGSLWHKLSSLLITTQSNESRQHHLETEVLTELAETFKEIKLADGRSLAPENMLTRSVFNITSAIALGKRFDHSDPEFQNLKENILFLLTNCKSASPVNMFPILARLASSKFEQVKMREEQIFGFFKTKLSEHAERLDRNKCLDYMDVFLSLSAEERGQAEYSEANFFRSIIDLFLGGADTSTSMLLWQLVYMSKYQDVQRQCQEEIGKVVGRDRQVTLDDRANLPYTDATFKELGRSAGTIVNTALRTNTEETMIGEFQIPKDSIVICDLRQSHIDKEFWDEPEKFHPDRFLEPIKDKPYHPFGMGPRQCVAKIAAESMLFLSLSNMLQTFHINATGTPEQSDVSFDSFYTGVSLRPKLANFTFSPRI
ncbi:cytochrome P450 2U1-like [Mizuhopecten yessoensis]|uniref:Cytochrome P450 2U1 n=1 Tax=Mizuhopecten yessoensis TaxID=6573 RepID=A0A210QYQ5_MIZYE|nr:cytochrome P450 2U1-like [Mizuhopecten yessoensis]OWF53847.1 Cytochrome P450 2U1 [Mizuhopecten yessoensis]